LLSAFSAIFTLNGENQTGAEQYIKRREKKKSRLPQIKQSREAENFDLIHAWGL